MVYTGGKDVRVEDLPHYDAPVRSATPGTFVPREGTPAAVTARRRRQLSIELARPVPPEAVADSAGTPRAHPPTGDGADVIEDRSVRRIHPALTAEEAPAGLPDDPHSPPLPSAGGGYCPERTATVPTDPAEVEDPGDGSVPARVIIPTDIRPR